MIAWWILPAAAAAAFFLGWLLRDLAATWPTTQRTPVLDLTVAAARGELDLHTPEAARQGRSRW